MSATQGLIDREVLIRRLRRERPRRHFLRTSVLLFSLLVIYAWTAGGLLTPDFFSERRLANFHRFIGDLRPYPLQHRAWDSRIAFDWSLDLLVTRALPGAVTTLAIAVAAITLAGLAAALLALPASRAWATAEPYAPETQPASAARRAAWSVLVALTRAFLIFLRAIPEYIWAFLALAIVGPNVWAAVFALAIHNAGILGKLNAEVVENVDPQPLASLRTLGASRLQIAFGALGPLVLPRSLLLFFYRWETCVREATVLGMLGIISLGFYIQDARARQYYDVMTALILTGSGLVILGDLVSAIAREAVRRAR
jgi:phosphonate transport system permease protein